jgi:hypothetical protein
MLKTPCYFGLALTLFMAFGGCMGRVKEQERANDAVRKLFSNQAAFADVDCETFELELDGVTSRFKRSDGSAEQLRALLFESFKASLNDSAARSASYTVVGAIKVGCGASITSYQLFRSDSHHNVLIFSVPHTRSPGASLSSFS